MSTNSVDVPVAERLNIDMRSEETLLGTSSSICPSYEHITIFDFDDTLLPVQVMNILPYLILMILYCLVLG